MSFDFNSGEINPKVADLSFYEARDAFERAFVLHAFAAEGFNVAKTAERLRLARSSLYRHLDRLQIHDPKLRDKAMAEQIKDKLAQERAAAHDAHERGVAQRDAKAHTARKAAKAAGTTTGNVHIVDL